MRSYIPRCPANAGRSGGVPSYGWDAGLCSITFERPSTGLSDPDAPDGLAASLNLALRSCESGADEACERQLPAVATVALRPTTARASHSRLTCCAQFANYLDACCQDGQRDKA
jgi:hypothetical protein